MLGRSLVRIWLMGGGGGVGVVVGVIRDCCCCCVVVTLINRSEVVAINYGFPLITLSSFGVIKNALNAKQMNTTPPTMVTIGHGQRWKMKKRKTKKHKQYSSLLQIRCDLSLYRVCDCM